MLPASAPATSIAFANSATVGEANRARNGGSRSKSRLIRAITWIASSEWPPRLEEIVLDPGALDPENLGPDPAQRLLGGSARRDILGRHLRADVRRRQGLAIDLAVGGQRQRIQDHERRRNHVVGQLPLQRRPQRRRGRLRPVAPRHISNEPLVAGAILARQDHRFAHPRDPGERRLDLARLDAVTTDLHLMIDPPEIVDVPVGSVARQVARPIEPLSRAAKRVRDKPLRRQIGTPKIAPRQTRPANVKLSRNAHGNRKHMIVQKINPSVPDRTTDRNSCLRSPALARVGRNVNRRLGRSIEVVQFG